MTYVNPAVAAFARSTTGHVDLADALSDAFSGKAFITLAPTRCRLNGGYADVAVGTEVTLTSVTNAGFNGMQASLRTEDGGHINTGWENISGAARYMS